MFRRLLLAVVASLGLSSGAAAAVIVPIEIFGTGVDADGNVVANGTVGDLHYTLTSAPAGATTELRAATSANGFPIGPWVGDNTTSRWIGPNSNGQLDGPVGDYVYETTFDLTGLDASTAILRGNYATDNGGSIRLNGTPVGPASGGFTGFTPFEITTGFVSGINILSFDVFNAGGPTGLRVEVSGEAMTAVPVPGAALLLVTGIAALAVPRVSRRA